MNQGLLNNKWIDHFYPVSLPEEVKEFINLWEAIDGVQLTNKAEDTIMWRWTADGVFGKISVPCTIFRTLHYN